jgi:HAE1 family hydrophobic/amphiphilic exporter-1
MVRIGGNQIRTLYQFTLQSGDLNSLYTAAAAFEKRLHTVPGLTDVNSDLQIASPTLSVNIAANVVSPANDFSNGKRSEIHGL